MRTPDRAWYAAVRDAARGSLARGTGGRWELPGGGLLDIERPLPFLVIALAATDPAVAQLSGGLASRLLVPADPEYAPGVDALARAVVGALAQRFDALCLMWLACGKPGDTAALRLRVSPDPRWDALAESAARIFGDVHVEDLAAAVHVTRGHPQHARLRGGLEVALCEIEVVVPALHRDPEDARLYPLRLLELSRAITASLARAVDAFVERNLDRKEPRPRLGRAGLDPAACEADRVLCDAAVAFEVLLQLTPHNLDAMWKRLVETDFDEEPRFSYRPLRDDPVALKRRVFDAPVDEIEDPFVAELLREKQDELDRMLSMLRDRGETFLHESEQIYGRPDRKLLHVAQRILATPVPPSRETEPSLDLEHIVSRARDHMARYRDQDPLFPDEIELRDDIAASFMVSRGRLLMRADASLSAARLDALLEHEVGTHVLTWFNGSAQPLRLLGVGLAGCEALQEGLAVLAEHLAGALNRSRMRVLAARVVAADAAAHGTSFLELFHRLTGDLGFSRRSAFQTAVRALRGGGMTKDLAYLRGLCQLLDHLRAGGALEPLYTGKMSLAHLPAIGTLEERGVIAPPRVLPLFLGEKATAARLEHLRRSDDTQELVLTLAEGSTPP